MSEEAASSEGAEPGSGRRREPADRSGSAGPDGPQPSGDRDFAHLDDEGRARMVDVSHKTPTRRRAVAEGRIRMSPETLEAVREDRIEKGDVLTVARLGAVGGAKRTADLIPLCHPLPLDGIDVQISEDRELPGIRVRVAVTTEARTGVEMEALSAVAAGLLTVYDMCKSMDRGMTIDGVRLLEKTGGRSGTWRR